MTVLYTILDTPFFSSYRLATLIALFFIGLFFLIKGSDLILIYASKIAHILHISDYVIGITIVALSTSLPEFFVSSSAAYKGLGVISIANVVGSNTYNIIFIFMLLTLFANNIFRISLKNILLLSLLNLLVLGMSIIALEPIPRYFGFIFLFGLFLYFSRILRSHRIETLTQKTAHNTENANSSAHIHVFRNLFLSILLLMIGVAILYVGSELFLYSSKAFGSMLGIPDHIIGVVFIALGTSLPELMVTISAIIKMYTPHSPSVHTIAAYDTNGQNHHDAQNVSSSNFQDMAEGNLIGSNIINILGVLGLSIAIAPLDGVHTMRMDSIVMSIATMLLLLLLYQKIIAQKILGISLFLTMIVYIILLTR